MREKRRQDKPEPLFEYPPDEFDANEVFTADFEGVEREKLIKEAREEEDELRPPKEVPPVVHAQPISRKDPLNPELFAGHHRRMEREERRMQVHERQGLMATALRLKVQREQLAGPAWIEVLHRVVRIDSSDQAELRRKRDLAMKDMDTFLKKFDEYHRRVNRREQARPKTPSTKKSKPTISKQQAAKASKSSKKKAREPYIPPTYEPPVYDKPTLFFRPFVFGEMLPPRHFPFQEFELPQLLMSEVETFDLLEQLQEKRKKLKIRLADEE